jgi:integrase/recombinase XerD
MNLFKRGSTYYVRAQVDGKRYTLTTGETTEREATRRAHILLADLYSKGADGITLGEWAERYKQTYSARKADPELDKAIIGKALKAFGASTPMSAITKSMCLAYLHDRSALGLADGTVNREQGLLGALWNAAIAEGVCSVNPWKGIKRKAEPHRDRIVTPAEEVLLRAKLTPKYGRWLTFMLGTGLRLEEARAITPAQIKDGLIHVPATAAKGGKARVVPIAPSVQEAIDAQLKAEGKLWQQNQQRFREVLTEGCLRAGVIHVFPHALRHTFATRQALGGVDPYVLSRLLGHSSIEITAKYYVNLKNADLTAKLIDSGTHAKDDDSLRNNPPADQRDSGADRRPR